MKCLRISSFTDCMLLNRGREGEREGGEREKEREGGREGGRDVI